MSLGLSSTNLFAENFALRSETTPLGIHYVVLSGDITDQSPQELKHLLDRTPEVETVIALNSPGGSLIGGVGLGEVIRQNRLRTMIFDGAICFSACAFAFLGGTERKVGDYGQLGVHQFRWTSAKDGQSATEQTQASGGALLAYFREMGIDTQVLVIAMMTPAHQMHIFNRLELALYQIDTPDSQAAEPAVEKCPFPKGMDVQDPLNLYPGCH